VADAQRHVDLLLQKYARGRTIADIERENELTPGALGHHLKPSQRGSAPKLEVLKRFADALSAPMREVSEAFFADAGVAMDGGEPLPAAAKQLLDLYLGLDDTRRRLARKLLQTLADDQDAERSA
jgi:hypothetical protein